MTDLITPVGRGMCIVVCATIGFRVIGLGATIIGPGSTVITLLERVITRPIGITTDITKSWHWNSPPGGSCAIRRAEPVFAVQNSLPVVCGLPAM